MALTSSLRRFAYMALIAVLFFCSATFINFPHAAAAGDIIYVNTAATGDNDGSSWSNAYTDLITAIAASTANKQIWVAKGVYKPTTTNDQTISFALKDGVAIYGGFAGNETLLGERNWATNLTILSGDIDGNDTTDASGIVTDPANINGNNSYHVVNTNGLAATAILNGVTITAGNASSAYPDNVGGGIYNSNSSPTLANLSFVGNMADADGGGLYNTSNSSPVLTEVTFTKNSATNGGGLYNDTSTPTLTDITFSGNSADNGGAVYSYNSSQTFTKITFIGNSAVKGGGIYNEYYSNPTLTEVVFSENTASDSGGALYNESLSEPAIIDSSFTKNSAAYGGAIFNDSSSPTFTNVSFVENTASGGAGVMYNQDSSPSFNKVAFIGNSGADFSGAILNEDASNPTFTNVIFSGNSADYGGAVYNYVNSSPTFTNVAFSGNSADYGGAIYNENNSSPTFTNATFSGNSAIEGGAIYNYDTSNPDILNTIIWGNSSAIVNESSTATISYSLVEGCNPSGTWTTACGTNNGNNLTDTDPQFVNPISSTNAPTTTGDLRLLASSPAIDVGSNSLNTTTTDLDGNARIFNSTIDLGAYEYSYTLTTNTVGSGSVTYTPNTTTYAPGTVVTLTATADSGWTFAGWSGDLSGTTSPATLTMNSTKVVTATFSNDAPTANAGANQTVDAGSLVTLNGSTSSDADPSQTLSYAWTQISGTSVTLSSSTAQKPSFTAPATAGALVFSLIVTDNLGTSSDADTVTITVNETGVTIYLPTVAR